MVDVNNHPLKGYFTALDAGDFEACAACFAEDAVYLHPPSNRDVDNKIFARKGRESIREWLRQRGKRPHHHRILFAAVNGSSCFVEGRGGGGGVHLHAFASHAILDSNGLIKRYIAFVEYPDKDDVVDSSIAFDNVEFRN